MFLGAIGKLKHYQNSVEIFYAISFIVLVFFLKHDIFYSYMIEMQTNKWCGTIT